MNQKILVTSPRVTPDSTRLMEAAKSVGQPVIRLQSFRPTPQIENVPIAVYGEALFAIILTSNLHHVVIEPTADWLTDLPQQYRQRSIIQTTMGDARQIDAPRFIKNADGMKSFDARVYDSGGALPSVEFYSDDYAVLVSEPVDWEVEYRCFTLERQLLTLSIYFRNGELAKSPEGVWLEAANDTASAREFCETLLQDESVPIPPTCVIDVGRITGRGWAVIEANPAYGSGIYGCDPDKVLQVVNRTTLHVNDVTDADSRWIIPYEVED